MRSSPRLMLLAAGGAVVAAATVWFLAFQTDPGERLDARTLAHAMVAYESRPHALATGVVHLADPLPFALFAAGLVAIALARGRARLACAAAVTLLAANVTTEALKQLTADPGRIARVPSAHVAVAAWPSGHTTAAVLLGLWLAVVAPAPLRPLAIAMGAALALAVGASVVALGSHFPSDVLGALCVATAWTLTSLAALAPRTPLLIRRPT